MHFDDVVGFGATFVPHHGSLNFGGTPFATEQKAITVDLFRKLRFICVYPVGGYSIEEDLPALSIGSLEQGGVLMVGMQHVFTVRVTMRWA